MFVAEVKVTEPSVVPSCTTCKIIILPAAPGAAPVAVQAPVVSLAPVLAVT